jgi:hypothetical protein
MAAIGTRKLTLTIDGDEVAAEVSSATITSKEAKSDFVSFADAAAGGSREYGLKLKFIQDAESTSLWNQVWSAAGTDVAVVVRPYGNATASATEPHFHGTVTISEPSGDFLGGDADPSTSARFVTEVEWIFTAKPTKVTA